MSDVCPKCGAEASGRELLTMRSTEGGVLHVESEWMCGSFVLQGKFHQAVNICRIRELTVDLLNCASTMSAQKAGIEQLTAEVARLNATIETLRSGNDYKADACARLSSDNSRQRGEIRRLTAENERLRAATKEALAWIEMHQASGSQSLSEWDDGYQQALGHLEGILASPPHTR